MMKTAKIRKVRNYAVLSPKCQCTAEW